MIQMSNAHCGTVLSFFDISSPSSFRGKKDLVYPCDSKHAVYGIRYQSIENAWIRNVTITNFNHGIVLDRNAKWVTVTVRVLY